MKFIVFLLVSLYKWIHGFNINRDVQDHI